ncbi:MAG TPA: hypothetical protein VN493_07005 [Thermoanaerobaculia bacterium]|nr:hypothetical protein [Thermoanaerobaculia bacterium]
MLVAVLRELFPFLAALYLLDGLAWLGALDILFVRWAWGWSVFEGRGLRPAGVLPLDLAFSAAGPAAISTADGLLVPGPEVRGADVYDPERWTRLSQDHPEARDLRLSEAPAFDLHAFDLDAARERLEAFREETQLLRVLGWGLFVLIFLLLPAVLYIHPAPDRLLLPLVLGIAALYAATLGLTLLAGSRLRAKRAPSLVAMLLSPMSSLRAVRELGRNLFHDFDSLTVAALLLPRERFITRARAELHGAAHAAGRGDEGWRRHWSERRQALLRLLDRAGIAEAEALAAPAPRDLSARSWCPVCGIESRSEGGACEDCGLPLADFRK